jgi:hypothetical protein
LAGILVWRKHPACDVQRCLVQALARDTDIQASWKLAPPQSNGIGIGRGLWRGILYA